MHVPRNGMLAFRKQQAENMQYVSDHQKSSLQILKRLIRFYQSLYYLDHYYIQCNCAPEYGNDLHLMPAKRPG